MTERINEAFVDEQVAALQDEYRSVDVVETTMDVPADDFDECVTHAHEGYVGGAYAWVSRRPAQAGYPSETYAGGEIEREQALLVLPRGEREWGIPGDGVERDESFERAARRETLEETGVGCEITALWLLDRKTWRSTDPDDDRETISLHAFFDANYVGGSITVQPGEVDGAAWFANAPAALMEEAEFARIRSSDVNTVHGHGQSSSSSTNVTACSTVRSNHGGSVKNQWSPGGVFSSTSTPSQARTSR